MSGQTQHTTPNSRLTSQEVTIIHPFHPLRGKKVDIVGVRHQEGELDLIIRLPDGSQALVAVGLTDYQLSAEKDVSTKPSVLLDWAGLRQMANLVNHLQQKRGTSGEAEQLG